METKRKDKRLQVKRDLMAELRKGHEGTARANYYPLGPQQSSVRKEHHDATLPSCLANNDFIVVAFTTGPNSEQGMPLPPN